VKWTNYTVIVGRPDYVSDNPLGDTYMTSLSAQTAEQAGDEALKECAETDSREAGQDEDNDVDDYVIVAVIAGKHTDIQGRTDL
jgi:hypothetical protein